MNTERRDPALRRERLRELLGLEAAQVSGPHSAEAGRAEHERAGELVEPPPAPGDGSPAEVMLRGADGNRIPAFLLRPEPEHATGAGVVLVAGHGRGIDDLVRTDPTWSAVPRRRAWPSAGRPVSRCCARR